MRRPVFVAVLSTLLMVACSEQSTEPNPPDRTPSTSLDVIGVGACPATPPTAAQLLTQINQLLPNSPIRAVVIALVNALPPRFQDRLKTIVRTQIFLIQDFVLKAFYAGKLNGGKSAGTFDNVLQLIRSLYCYVGLTPPNFPSTTNGQDVAVGVVFPTSPTTTISTPSAHAAVTVPQGGAPSATTIVVRSLPNTPGPLLTSLNQYPLFFEFSGTTATGDVVFNQNVTVGVCPVAGTPVGNLRLAHNVAPNQFGDVEILPPATTVPGVSCQDLGFLSGADHSMFATGSTRWRAVTRALDPVVEALLPEPLHASAVALVTTAVGGTTKKFSPFGVVDVASNPASLAVKPGVSTHVNVTPGSVVSPSPAVVLKSANGTPIANVPVVFAASSGGTVSGGASQTVNTDASGVATAGDWNPGTTLGDHTLTATPPAIAQVGSVEPYKPAAAFNPTSLTFTATVVGGLNYLGTGYRYLVVSEGTPPTGFETPGFDDSGWSAGSAAFGFLNPVDVGCTLLSSGINTLWPANTQILLRRPFTIPGGGSLATVSVAIDNDIKVFVNGTNITSTAESDGVPVEPDEDGFIRHEGCASQDSFTFDATGLGSGVNLLVIQARDRGSSTYVDAKVEAVSF